MDDLLGPNGEHVNARSLRAERARETQREVDARMASWFSTSSEHSAYALEDVRELYKNTR